MDVSKVCLFLWKVLKQASSRLIGWLPVQLPATRFKIRGKRFTSQRPRLSTRKTTTQMYKWINEYVNKHQINIHTDELIHKYMAIFIHNLHGNTFSSPSRSERERYHYTIIRLPSPFHCPLPNMKYSMYLHLKMSIPFNITAWFASQNTHQGRG